MKKILIVALVLLSLGVMVGAALDKADYRGGWWATDWHNAVIGGITPTGYFEPLLGFNLLDDIDLCFGGTAGGTAGPLTIEWTTADANANCGLFDLPTGGAVDVPVVLFASADTNFGYFDGTVEPTVAVENLAGTAWIALDHSGTTLSRLWAGGASTYLTIATELAGSDIVLDAADAAAGTAQQYVSITGTTPAHAGGTPTDIFLDITPTAGINTAAANIHLLDLTFTTQAWATAVTSNYRGIYFAPTIGNASAGTNTVALIDVAAITGDASVSLYGIRAGALTGTGATENFISIGAGWDAGIDSDSPVTLSHADADLDVEDNITAGDIIIDEAAGVLSFTGATSATISTSTGTADIVLDSADDAANSAKEYVNISGTTPAHASGSPTDIFLDFDPTLGINTGAANCHLMDMTFTSPAWASAVASNLRGIYFAPTIGNASAGTNVVALIDVAAVTGDAEVSLYGIRMGALTGTGATEYAISIGANWDRAIDLASPFVSTSTLSAEDLASTDDADIANNLTVGDIIVDEAAGVIDFSGATSGTISTSVGTADLVLDSADDADGSDKTYVSITGSVPAHTGSTPTSVFLDITPTVGIPTVANTVNLVDLTFTTPVYATAVASTYRGVYFAPTIGAATLGTNTVALMDVAAITGDDTVSLYGIRAGALTGTAATENFISIGAGWDAGIDCDSPVTLSHADADLDVTDNITAGDMIIDEAAGVLDFSGATSGTISTSTGTADLVLDSADDADGSDKTYVSITGSVPIHTGGTPTSIFLDISPTVGIPTVANTVNVVDLTFTTPAYATAVASTYRGIYFAPTIGAATLGTNTVALMDVAAVTGDDTVSLYGLRFGALTGTGATEEAISIGSGWDYGVHAATNIKAAAYVIDDGDADLTVDSDNQTDGSAAANVPDFTDATADFLMTNIFKTILPFNGGLAGEDTDAAGGVTDSGGMVGSTVDVTTHDYNDGAGGANDVHCVCKDATDGATYVDLKTASSLTAWTNNYQLLPDAASEAAGDAVAIGFDEKFVEVVFNDLATNNGTLATWGALGGKWQYSTGAGTWSDLTVRDGTDANDDTGGQPFGQTGAITFADPGSGWVLATYDGEEAYWIQWVFTAEQLTQTPIIDDTNKDEPIVGIPTTDSFQAPYKCEIVDVRVTDMNATVHDQIIKFVVGNFTDGVFSAELSWAASQYSDKFALASALAADADDVIAIVVTDDGGSTQNPIWAVEFEVTYED